MMNFKVRIANDGKVYAVFNTWSDFFRTCWIFDTDQPVTNYLGYAAAIHLPAWRKDSFRDATVHG